jgi:hypothetical protein
MNSRHALQAGLDNLLSESTKSSGKIARKTRKTENFAISEATLSKTEKLQQKSLNFTTFP